MPLRLPPLAPLRIFEAAGRHLSFRRAAEELALTPSAISHGVVTLEHYLGIPLFTRERGKLALTPEGADYLTYVSEALSLVAIGTQRLPGRDAPRRITISCAPTFASLWLIPRLAMFRHGWMEVDVVVDTSHQHVGFPMAGFDFAIRMSRVPGSGARWDRLFGERLAPVTSPRYLETLRSADGSLDLARATPIHVTTVSEDWITWSDATGTSFRPGAGIHVDAIHLAFEAAACGLGVAMGRRPLVDEHLRRGTLVDASNHVIASETAYWLVSPKAIDHRQELTAFRRWLVHEAAAYGTG